MVKPFPFTEEGDLRTFSGDVSEQELQWHWDEQDRIISATHETDWLFQHDDCLPQKIQAECSIFIPEGEWHRLIKGTGNLTLQVLKCHKSI